MKEVTLPEGWVETKMNAISQVISGGTPSSKVEEYFAKPKDGIAWLTPADLSNYSEMYIKNGRRDITELGYQKSSARKMPKGSVLFTSRAPIGYVVIAENEISTNQGFKSFVLTENTSSEYLYFYLKSLKDFANSQGTGTTFKEISAKVCKAFPFLMPPLAEQQEIARRLEQHLAQVDSIKAKLDAIPKLLATFRQSVLADAFRGELTKDWVQQEKKLSNSYDDILKITADRALKITTKNKQPKEHLSNEEYDIPSHWNWTSLDTLSSKIVDGTHHTPTYTETGIPFISVKDVRDNKIYFDKTKFISEEEHIELSKRCPVERGDLLITKSGTIGRTAIVKTDNEFSLFVSVALIKPASTKVNMDFIQLALTNWINSIDISNRIIGTAIKNLHLRDMRVLAIPFPPLEEQTQIVARVEELFGFAERIEQQVQSASERVNLLTQSILAKAFRGELTADWRADILATQPELITGDNSAEALLTKISEQMQAGKKSKKKTKQNNRSRTK